MAHNKSALKRARQAEKHHTQNQSDRSRMRTFTKKVLTAVDAGDESVAQAALQQAMSELAKSAKKGVIHANQASRRVSRLHAKVKGMSQAA